MKIFGLFCRGCRPYTPPTIVLSLQIVQYLADGFVSVLAHNAEVVEDGTVLLDGLADAVLQDFEADADVESMLYEGFAGGVIDEVRVKV